MLANVKHCFAVHLLGLLHILQQENSCFYLFIYLLVCLFVYLSDCLCVYQSQL